MRLIIAGSRAFDRGDILLREVKYFVGEEKIRVLSGMAKGADMLGYNYAKIWNIPVDEHPADWNKYGKRVGYLRNIEMAKNADACIVFWDGKSKGSKMMIDIAKDYNLKLQIILF